MVASIPLPEGVPLHAASLEQTPLVVQPVVVQLLAVIGQQAERIKALDRRLATLEAQGQRNSSNSDRPPSSDPPWVRAKTTGETKRTRGLGRAPWAPPGCAGADRGDCGQARSLPLWADGFARYTPLLYPPGSSHTGSQPSSQPTEWSCSIVGKSSPAVSTPTWSLPRGPKLSSLPLSGVIREARGWEVADAGSCQTLLLQ